jgi:chemotaxis family two-component system response regulator Rcp1
VDTQEAKDVLVVDDNLADTALLLAVFRDLQLQHRLHIATDGEAALSFLHRQGQYAHAPRPDLIMLDLNLPKLHGRDVLRQVKQDVALRTIPVMVFTSSAAASDIASSYEAGANAYLIKPFQLEDMVNLIRAFVDFWCTRVTLVPHHYRAAES